MWEYIKNLSIKTKAFSLLIFIAVMAMFATWYDKAPEVNHTLTQAAPIAGTSNIPKVAIPLPSGIKVIPKNLVKKKVALPLVVTENPKKEVVATADIPPSVAGSEVVSVVDMDTGEVTILSREKDLSLFAFENKVRAGVAYGVSTEGTAARVYGGWNFLRVGRFHLGTVAEINTTTFRGPEARVMATIEYQN